MQYRLFLPSESCGKVEIVVGDLREILTKIEEPLFVGDAPQRQENIRQCVIADMTQNTYDPRRTPKYIACDLGIATLDQIVVPTDRGLRFVTACDMPIGDPRSVKLAELLNAEGTGYISSAHYPVIEEVFTNRRGAAHMVILEGEGKPNVLRDRVDEALRRIYPRGDFAFSEEIPIAKF